MNYNEASMSHSRSRLLGSSDHESLLRESFLAPNGRQEGPSCQKLKQLSNLFSNNLFLDDEWHSEDYLNLAYEEFHTGDDSWRLKGRMKTAGVALVVCLNIGVDPPDVVKPNPCGRKECWFDPTPLKQKGLDMIGQLLQQQYEKWQAKAKYRPLLDPSSEDLRKVCMSLRKNCRQDRILFHYNGHGVPKPTKNGELWVFGKHHTHYTPVAVREVRAWIGDPTIYVLDCSGAGMLIPHLVENLGKEDDASPFAATDDTSSKSNQPNESSLSLASAGGGLDSGSVVLAACKANEHLPFHPDYPADIFTSCLTTPTTIAIRWFILQNPESMRDANPSIAETIPGKDNDRKSPRGELNWILTAITDTIAWNTLPAKMFKRMFRHDLLVASLFRNFLMAKRIMKSFNCTPQSYPPLPDSTTHSLWQAWDMALGSFLTQQISLQKGSSMTLPANNMAFNMPSNLSFFTDQLSAFEMWLDFGTANSPPPLQLPVVLQVLLSQSHRLRALQLLKRYLSLGLEAVKVALILGIYPYIVKLLQNPAEETKQILISIWAAIIGFDASCRQELIREKSQVYFIQSMTSATTSASQRCLAAFVLSEICNGSKEGQQSCIQLGLHRACTNCFGQDEVMKCSTLKLWICLCLFKLSEEFLWAKYLCITEAGHTQLYPLLIDPDPTVRTAAVLALGELFGASSLSNNAPSAAGSGSATPSFRQMQTSLSSSNSDERDGSVRNSFVEEKDLIEAELQLALQILECCTDGSVMVRLEAVYALSKFLVQPAHIDCVKIVAKAIYERYHEKKNANRSTSRGSASPSAEGPSYGKPVVYPWFLTPTESRAIAEQVEAFIEVRNEEWNEKNTGGANRGRAESSNNVLANHPGRQSLLKGQYDGDLQSLESKTASSADSKVDQSNTNNNNEPSLATLMASAYVRLWLALTEVEGKDPHALISQAVATIRFRVHALIAIDERDRIYPRIPSAMNSFNNRDFLGNQINQGSSTKNNGNNSVFFSPDTPGDAANNNYSFGNFSENNLTPGAGSGRPPVNFPNWSMVSPPPRQTDGKMKREISNRDIQADGLGGGSYFASGNPDGFPTTPGQRDLTNNTMSTPYQGALPTPPAPQGPGNGGGGDSFYLHPFSPMGAPYGSPSRPKTIKFLGKLPLSSPNAGSLNDPNLLDGGAAAGSLGGLSANNNVIRNSTQIAAGVLATPVVSGSNHLQNNASSRSTPPAKNVFMDVFKDYLNYTEEDLMICFSSNHYEMAKKKFLEPSIYNFDPFQDPLSIEAKQNEYRAAKLKEMMTNERSLAEMFRDVEDRSNDILFMDRNKGKFGDDGVYGSYGSSMGQRTPPPPTVASSSNICKFEQKGNTMTLDSPMTPSMVMFHAFQDVVVACHDNTVEVWSTSSHARLMEIKNKHVLRNYTVMQSGGADTSKTALYRGTSHTGGQSSAVISHSHSQSQQSVTNIHHHVNVNNNINSMMNTVSAIGQRDSNGMPVRSNSPAAAVVGDIVAVGANNTARITAMTWINESYDALLLLGSDDGVVRVWRDTSHSDFTQSNAYTVSNNNVSGTAGANNPGTPPAPAVGNASSVELATAFCALPDIDLASRGSGTVLSWQQTAGTLVVGGNSNTIRVWDVGREQNVRTFHTGHETCLTALATTTVSNRAFSSVLPPAQHMLQPDIDNTPVTWTFAGFADGSIAIYDERVHTNGGRVHFSHSHSNWVSHAHLRADVAEVIIGSVRGTVKFWDLRTQRTYKTLEVQKSPLTALSVHSCAPIISTGSHAQFIKILTLSGEQIGNIIKYYDGFLGQRIGPVCSLAFHPHKLLLAASATDGVVSLFQANT
eukprot:gene10249-11344_t